MLDTIHQIDENSKKMQHTKQGGSLRGGDLDPPRTMVAVERERNERENRRSVRRARNYSHSDIPIKS